MTRVGFFNRRIRGFRIVEIGAMAVLVALVLVVYLAKDGAGDKRADIDRVQEQIGAEQDQIRLLQAEVAHQEQPERLEALAGQYLGLQPVAAKHEVAAAELASLARVAASSAANVGSELVDPSRKPVTPGLVPGAREHERVAIALGGTTSPTVFPGPRDKPGGDGVGGAASRADLKRRQSGAIAPTAAPPPAASVR